MHHFRITFLPSVVVIGLMVAETLVDSVVVLVMVVVL